MLKHRGRHCALHLLPSTFHLLPSSPRLPALPEACLLPSAFHLLSRPGASQPSAFTFSLAFLNT